ncbi:hypothetical protein [Shinella oryzae]|uniref:MarR family transcriptional regulator n=1 Tax=Shinella oryzae TaxID=2871820 RepID=A0ABY9K261_9HYPH|nr:hypothetical protein [Shinella oryzae]WLS01726.1 hypothetical protein Q9315_09725 [Shinella oryzae]
MKLVGYEAKAFSAWRETEPDFDVISFSTVAKRAEIDRKKVRRAVRGLARKGLTKFYRTSWTDDGEPHGAGYGLTPEGRALIDADLDSGEA